jgi:CheY-like chemotaxis protein
MAKTISMQRIINILLIEDDLLDQMEVKRTLEKKGIFHRLKIAVNGEEALKKLDEDNSEIFNGKPDIIPGRRNSSRRAAR